MKAISTLLILLFASASGFSCVWISGTKYNTESITVGGISPANRIRHSMNEDIHSLGVRMVQDNEHATNYGERCDYAVGKIYLGQYKEAVDLLVKLEKEKPGEYSVAANLGTAYELVGNNGEALKWIQEGMRRNHSSHYGTEWLHVKILETKIAGDSYLSQHHSLLDLNPETIGDNITVDGQTYSVKAVAQAFQYQLQERVQFVKPKDPIVAALLFDYAAVEAATGTLESAQKLLTLTIEYSFPSEKIQPLMQQYDRKISWRITKQWGTYALLILAAVWGLWLLHKRGIFVISSKDRKKRQRN